MLLEFQLEALGAHVEGFWNSNWQLLELRSEAAGAQTEGFGTVCCVVMLYLLFRFLSCCAFGPRRCQIAS